MGSPDDTDDDEPNTVEIYREHVPGLTEIWAHLRAVFEAEDKYRKKQTVPGNQTRN
jgi:hypothetical protein